MLDVNYFFQRNNERGLKHSIGVFSFCLVFFPPLILLKEREGLQEWHNCLPQKLDEGLSVKTWHLLQLPCSYSSYLLKVPAMPSGRWQMSLLLIPLQNHLAEESVFFQCWEKEVKASLKAKRRRSRCVLARVHNVLLFLGFCTFVFSFLYSSPFFFLLTLSAKWALLGFFLMPIDSYSVYFWREYYLSQHLIKLTIAALFFFVYFKYMLWKRPFFC